MKPLCPIVIIISIVFVGCRERPSTVQKQQDHARPISRQREFTELGKANTRHQPPANHDSIEADSTIVSDLLAICKRFEKRDATGSVNFIDLIKAYKDLAKIDPELALEQFDNPEAFFSIGPALFGVLEIAAAKDPDLIVHWLNEGLSKFEDQNQTIPLISMALNKLAVVDPGKALAALQSMNLPATSEGAVISALFRGLAGSDPAAAIQLSSSLDSSLVSLALAGAAEGALKKDPMTARTIANEIPNMEIRQRALDGVFAEWFRSDPRIASDELMKMDHKAIEDLLVGGVQNPRSLLYQISKNDPTMLLSLLDEFYPTSVNSDLFVKTITATVTSQPDLAFSTISKLPEGEMKLDLYREAYGTLLRDRPEQAMTMFAIEKDQAIRAAALPQMASLIGTKGLDESLRFVEQLNNDAEKSVGFSTAFNAICHSDVEAAASYLLGDEKQVVLLSAQERERGYKVVAYNLAADSLDEARVWMSKLPSKEQPNAMVGIASQMAERNAQELGDYLNSIEKDKVWAAGVKVLIATIESSDVNTVNKWKQSLKNSKFEAP